MIVDAQVHLWKAHSAARPWPNPAAKPQLPEPFGHERLLALMDEGGVDRAILVPPSWEGNRNDYALEAAAKHPQRFAVMGRLDTRDSKLAAQLPGWKKQPGMLGIRVTFIGPHVEWIKDGSTDWLWPAAEKAGLPIMFLAVHMQELNRIAERHPGLALIVDHMGLSMEGVGHGLKQSLLDNTVALARFPNVSVKLSGAPGYTKDPYPFRELTADIRHVFDAYGPRRSYWGTDLTNSFDKATYRQRIAHFRDEVKLSSADLEWVMGRAILERLGWK